MNIGKLRIAAAILALATTQVANALVMNFEYTFANGTVLSGSFDGTVQADNDTVFINSFGAVSYDGSTFDSIDAGEFGSVSDFPIGALQPQVSFSGDTMDIFTCPSGFDLDGNCVFSEDGGFFIHNGVNPLWAFDDVAAGNILGSEAFEAVFNADAWSLIAVPVPAALPLFVCALSVLGLRRWR